jgi:predicted ArsR family transcriptional regulator
MTITSRILALLKERGPSTVDDIAPHIPDIDRHRLMRRMQDARTYGLLCIVQQGSGLGKGRGKAPSVYDVAPERIASKRKTKSTLRVCSVWELAKC